MKRVSLLVVLGIVSTFGLGIQYAPKTAALGPGDNTCRAVLILDHSGSVGGNIGKLRNAAKALFGSQRINHSKIELAFWSFSGNANRWYNGHYNRPYYGFVPTTSPSAAAQNQLDNLVSEGSTFYNWALGYDNGPSAPRGYTHQNVDTAPIGNNSDVLVFTTDGAPTPAPDTNYAEGLKSAQSARNLYLAKYYNARPDYPRTIVGAVIDGHDTIDGRPSGVSNAEAKRRLVRVVVNGSETNGTNVFDVADDYSNFTSQVKILIKRACDYNLTPTLNLTNSRVDPSQPINIQADVNNDSIGRKSQSTEWRITRLYYPPGATTFGSLNNKNMNTSKSDPALGSNDISGSDPCAIVTVKAITPPAVGGNKNCNWHTGNTRFDGGNVPNPLNQSDVAGNEVGSILCYFLSVRPPGFELGDTIWRHSNLRCVIVAKSPHVHIQGGDLRVIHSTPASGMIAASTNGAGTIGSWVEYGVFSTGQNSRVSSASTGNMAPNTLTFRNTPVASLGNFTPLNVSDIPSYFTATGTGCPASIDIATITGAGRHDYNCAGDVNISGSLNAGVSVTIRTTGKVTITGNISKPASYGNIKDIPQLVVIGNKIWIHSSVTNVDAWLLTLNNAALPGPYPNDQIDTCYDQHNAAGQVGAGTCNQTLVINGPVKTNWLRLFRTAGAGSGDPNVAAESINLRPDAYLWLYLRSNNALKLRTNAIHELPPRY